MVRLAVAILGFVAVVRGGVFRAVGLGFGRAAISCRCLPRSPSLSRSSPRPRLFRATRNAGKLRDDVLLLARSIDVALTGHGGQDRQGNCHDQRNGQRGQPRDRTAFGADRHA